MVAKVLRVKAKAPRLRLPVSLTGTAGRGGPYLLAPRSPSRLSLLPGPTGPGPGRHGSLAKPGLSNSPRVREPSDGCLLSPGHKRPPAVTQAALNRQEVLPGPGLGGLFRTADAHASHLPGAAGYPVAGAGREAAPAVIPTDPQGHHCEDPHHRAGEHRTTRQPAASARSRRSPFTSSDSVTRPYAA